MLGSSPSMTKVFSGIEKNFAKVEIGWGNRFFRQASEIMKCLSENVFQTGMFFACLGLIKQIAQFVGKRFVARFAAWAGGAGGDALELFQQFFLAVGEVHRGFDQYVAI